MPSRRSPASPPATPRLGALPTLTLILSALGAAVSVVTLVIHHRLSAGQSGYTSFCDVSERLSCDAVLGSAYAQVLGLPVAVWGLAGYLGAAAIGVWLLRAAAQRSEDAARAATALVAFTGAMLAISIYFLAVALFVIGVACPMCLTLDAVNVALFATAVAALWGCRETGFRPAAPLAAAAAVTAAAVAALALLQGSGDAAEGPLTIERVRRQDPRFYAWYVSQPVTGMPEGSEQAPGGVTIVEFSDFECPHCRRAYLDLSRVLSEEPDVHVVHRNFPLQPECNPAVKAKVHRYACGAAIASECAARQGRGDAYNRALFLHQDALGPDELRAYARDLGLDMRAFERCLESPEAAEDLARDVAAGAAAGVESTPTLFINGRRIQGGFPRAIHYRYAFAIERGREAGAARN